MDGIDPNDRDTGTTGAEGSGVADTGNALDTERADNTDDLDALEEGARSLAKKRRAPVREVLAALERVLSHAEGHGEAYHGAVDDHTALRAYMNEQYD